MLGLRRRATGTSAERPSHPRAGTVDGGLLGGRGVLTSAGGMAPLETTEAKAEISPTS